MLPDAMFTCKNTAGYYNNVIKSNISLLQENHENCVIGTMITLTYSMTAGI